MMKLISLSLYVYILVGVLVCGVLERNFEGSECRLWICVGCTPLKPTNAPGHVLDRRETSYKR